MPKPTLVFCFLGTLGGIISLPIIVKKLNLGDIFYFFLDGADISIYSISTRCKKVVAITPSAILTLRIFLVLVFLTSLALVNRKLLVLTTRRIIRRDVSGLSLFGVFFLLFGRFVPSEILEIDFPGPCG